MSDVWIEVNSCSSDLWPFYETTVEVRPVPGFGSSGISHMVVKFNLTAYVRHMINEAQKGTEA